MGQINPTGGNLGSEYPVRWHPLMGIGKIKTYELIRNGELKLVRNRCQKFGYPRRHLGTRRKDQCGRR